MGTSMEQDTYTLQRDREELWRGLWILLLNAPLEGRSSTSELVSLSQENFSDALYISGIKLFLLPIKWTQRNWTDQWAFMAEKTKKNGPPTDSEPSSTKIQHSQKHNVSNKDRYYKKN